MEKRTAWQRAIEAGTNWSAAEAKAVLDAQSKSGASILAFAREHGIVPKRLYWWRYRLAVSPQEKRTRSSEPVGRLIPLTVVESVSPARSRAEGRVVVIDGALRVEVDDPAAVSPAWIATLVRSVREGA